LGRLMRGVLSMLKRVREVNPIAGVRGCLRSEVCTRNDVTVTRGSTTVHRLSMTALVYKQVLSTDNCKHDTILVGYTS
jgi:hypothetical protein